MVLTAFGNCDYVLLYGGIFGGNAARLLVFKDNLKIFNKGDISVNDDGTINDPDGLLK